MIPLATPRDGELVNLSQIVKIRSHPKGYCEVCTYFDAPDNDTYLPPPVSHDEDGDRSCTVYFSDGRSEIYTGEEAKRLNIDMQVMLKIFRDSMQAIFEPPSITPPNGVPRGFRGFKG